MVWRKLHTRKLWPIEREGDRTRFLSGTNGGGKKFVFALVSEYVSDIMTTNTAPAVAVPPYGSRRCQELFCAEGKDEWQGSA